MVQNRKSYCLNILRQQILSLALEPGSDLDETKLGQEFGISRTPLREVLQKLAGEGYVDLTQNKGAKVVSMDLGTMRIFFQTAPLIYANIARLAAENRTIQQLDKLKQAQFAFTSATRGSDPAQSAIHNHSFHQIIGDMAENLYLKPSLDRMLIDHTRLSQTFYRPTSTQEAVLVTKARDQHDALISAIEARETNLAIDLTLQHWDLSRDRLERYVHPEPLSFNITSLQEKKHAI